MTSGGVRYAVEATGVPAVLRTAMDSLAQGGMCVLVGAAALRATAEIDVSTLLFGRRLLGTIEGDAIPQEFIPRLIELYRAGLFRFDTSWRPIRSVTSIGPRRMPRAAGPSSRCSSGERLPRPTWTGTSMTDFDLAVDLRPDHVAVVEWSRGPNNYFSAEVIAALADALERLASTGARAAQERRTALFRGQ